MDTSLIVSLSGLGFLLLCGGMGAYCSNEKGRPGHEGFWFGVLLGPFGVIAAACLPEQEIPGYLGKPVEPVDLTADRDDIGDSDEPARSLKGRSSWKRNVKS